MKGDGKQSNAYCVAILGLFWALTAAAGPNAQVDAVQTPAWLERAGVRLPLTVGMALENRDKLRTGAGARVIVRLADGSSFKLGENALVTVNALNQEKAGRFTGGLDVKTGDLHLVSHEFREAPVKRAINVRFGQVTALVRGEADITGQAVAGAERLALRDGSVIVSHPLTGAVLLDTPLQTFGTQQAQAPVALATVDVAAGAQWALRSELRDAAGAQQQGGPWSLRFGSFNKDEALLWHGRLAQAGYAASIRPLSTVGDLRYEVRLMNLVTEREARSLGEQLVLALQLPEPKIVKS